MPKRLRHQDKFRQQHQVSYGRHKHGEHRQQTKVDGWYKSGEHQDEKAQHNSSKQSLYSLDAHNKLLLLNTLPDICG